MIIAPKRADIIDTTIKVNVHPSSPAASVMRIQKINVKFLMELSNAVCNWKHENVTKMHVYRLIGIR